MINVTTKVIKWIKKRKALFIQLGFWALLVGDCSFILYGFEHFTTLWFIIGAWVFTIGVWYYGRENKLFIPTRKDYGLSH